MNNQPPTNSLQTIARISLVIFVSEFLVMLIMHYLQINFESNPWLAALLDATANTLFSASVCYAWIFSKEYATNTASATTESLYAWRHVKQPAIPLGSLFGKFVVVIFIAESIIMLGFAALDLKLDIWTEAFLDACLLTAIASPILYYWINLRWKTYASGIKKKFIFNFLHNNITATFIFLIIPAILVLVLISMAIYRSETLQQEQNKVQRAVYNMAITKEMLVTKIQLAAADTLLLAHQITWINLTPGVDRIKHITTKTFIDLATIRKDYNKLYFIDNTGGEIVGIELQQDHYQAASKANGINKASQYCLQQTIDKSTNKIFVSEFNVDFRNNQSVQKTPPTMHLCTPVFDSEKKQIKGFVVLSYLLKTLVTLFTNELAIVREQPFLLLKENGYILYDSQHNKLMNLNPRPGKNNTFADQFPQAWPVIAKTEEGQIHTDNNLLLYTTVNFSQVKIDSTQQPHIAQSPTWKLITLISTDFDLVQLQKYRDNLIFFTLILVTLVVFGGWNLAKAIDMQKHTMRALRRSEARFRSLMEQTNELVWEIDMSGEFMYCSPGFETLLGYDPKELVGKPYSNIITERERVRLTAIIDQYLQSQEPIKKEEFILQHNNTTEIIVETDAIPFFNHQHECRGYRGISRDITIRKHAEQQIRENQRALTTLISNVPGIVYKCIHNQCRTLTFVSDWCINLTGYSADELLNGECVFFDIIHIDDRTRVTQHIETAVSKREPYQLIYRIITRPGHEKWVEEQGRCIVTENPYQMWLEGIILDITNQKEAESKLETYAVKLEEMVKQRTMQLMHSNRLASLGVFAAGMAHEVNNPNSFILGNAQFLQQFCELAKPILERHGHEDESGRLNNFICEIGETIHGIVDGSKRISTIIDSLKTYSRDGSGDKMECRVIDTVNDAAKILNHKLKHGVSLQLSIPADIVICADRQQMSQVFVNLFNNAIEAMEQAKIEDGKTITVNSKTVNDHVWIYVMDNGPGIPDEVSVKIFDPFFTTKGKANGTGLGLSIVNGIIRDHQGQITIQTNKEKHTTFLLVLPSFALFKKLSTKVTKTVIHKP